MRYILWTLLNAVWTCVQEGVAYSMDHSYKVLKDNTSTLQTFGRNESLTVKAEWVSLFSKKGVSVILDFPRRGFIPNQDSILFYDKSTDTLLGNCSFYSTDLICVYATTHESEFLPCYLHVRGNLNYSVEDEGDTVSLQFSYNIIKLNITGNPFSFSTSCVQGEGDDAFFMVCHIKLPTILLKENCTLLARAYEVNGQELQQGSVQLMQYNRGWRNLVYHADYTFKYYNESSFFISFAPQEDLNGYSLVESKYRWPRHFSGVVCYVVSINSSLRNVTKRKCKYWDLSKLFVE